MIIFLETFLLIVCPAIYVFMPAFKAAPPFKLFEQKTFLKCLKLLSQFIIIIYGLSNHRYIYIHFLSPDQFDNYPGAVFGTFFPLSFFKDGSLA